MSESEYYAATRKVVKNLQQLIDEPELYIVAIFSSPPSDQLAVIPDRLDDLYEHFLCGEGVGFLLAYAY